MYSKSKGVGLATWWINGVNGERKGESKMVPGFHKTRRVALRSSGRGEVQGRIESWVLVRPYREDLIYPGENVGPTVPKRELEA